MIPFLQKIAQSIHKGANNAVNNVTHPKNLVSNAENAGKGIVGFLQHGNHIDAPPPPNGSTGVLNPTSAPNVTANLQMQHALDVWGATPELRNIANQTTVRGHQSGDPAPWQKPGAPKDNSMSQGTFASPNQTDNSRGGQVVLAERGSDPYIAVHELLHNAFARKTPEAQQQFLQLAQQNATPANRATISEHPYSQANDGQDISKFPYSAAQETHSMLPEEPTGLRGALKDYYSQYFNHPRPYQETDTKYATADAAGFNAYNPGYPKPQPQFDWWRD